MCVAPPLFWLEGIEKGSALILVDDLRNAAYLRIFKLCSSAGALYMTKSIVSPA
ncbi:putative RNA-directed DNA polymerase from transposon BS, partial [Araneus ventricosus]